VELNLSAWLLRFARARGNDRERGAVYLDLFAMDLDSQELMVTTREEQRSSVPRFVRTVPQFARSQGYEERGPEDLDSSALHLDSSLLDLDLMEFEVTKSREEYWTSIHPHSASRREAMAAVDNCALVDAGIRRSCCSCIN